MLEESLRVSERRYRDLFENAGELIVVTDPEWRITSANRAFLEAVGFPEEEVIGEDVQRFLSKTDLARARDRVDADGEPDPGAYTMELRVRGGQKRVLEVLEPPHRGGRADRRHAGDRARHHRTDRARGAAPPGAEDGGGRPPRRRDRARLQQPADGDPRLRATSRSTLLGQDDRDAPPTSRRSARAAQRAAALTRQLLAFSRRQVRRSRQVLDLNDVVAEIERRCCAA